MKYLNLIIAFFIISSINAGEIENYLLQYAKTGTSDYSQEQELIKNTRFKKLIEGLAPYYADSLNTLRLKAYYLTYKKGISEEIKNQQKAVLHLVNGCWDKNGGVVGQNISYLTEFPTSSFTEEAKEKINTLIVRRKLQHTEKLILLAAYIGTGKEQMMQKLTDNDISMETKWALSLALSRLGESDFTANSVRLAKRMPVNNQLVANIVPGLIFTRQKQAIDYCIELLKQTGEKCISADPDKPTEIRCGYRIMELLALAIQNYPFTTDGTGSLTTTDYKKALETLEKWFEENPDYTINTTNY